MFCTSCGLELRDIDRFCSQCGRATPVAQASLGEKRLALPLEGKKILGVCAGFARYLEEDVTLVRIVWLVMSLATGVGFLGYLIVWLLMPQDAPMVTLPAPRAVQQNGQSACGASRPACQPAFVPPCRAVREWEREAGWKAGSEASCLPHVLLGGLRGLEASTWLTLLAYDGLDGPEAGFRAGSRVSPAAGQLRIFERFSGSQSLLRC